MAEIIEGRNAVVESLRSGARLERILIADGLPSHPALDEIIERARGAGVQVRHVARREIEALSERGAHQGVVAYAAPYAYAELASMIRAAEGLERALVVVLDHVTDPGNLGAIVRSVEVAGGQGVIIPKDRSAAVGQVAHKSSAGATAYLPIARVTNLTRAIEELKTADFWVAGADERASDDLWRAPLDGRVALVLGSEGAGLSRLVKDRCDFLVSIPVAGHVTSLNVAQATTLLSFEWVRRGR